MTKSMMGRMPGPISSMELAWRSSSSNLRMISSKSASNCGVMPCMPTSPKAPAKKLPLGMSKPPPPSSMTGSPEKAAARRCGARARAKSCSSISASWSTVRPASPKFSNGPAPAAAAAVPPGAGTGAAAEPLTAPRPRIADVELKAPALDTISTLCRPSPGSPAELRRCPEPASFPSAGLLKRSDALSVSRSFFCVPFPDAERWPNA
mmetsp:Transcript_47647/g.120737  ORF Transcript_47647/g.120737 Transcript_47647/m.120737 type:complete len:207 (+) Transcript_47647:230-850(+)